MAALKEYYRQLKSDLVGVKRTLSMPAALPRFFRERITLQQAGEEIKRLLDTRAKRFLELTRLQIYMRPESPYLRLLKHAGCEFSDLKISVERHGLENTLAKLGGEGVYLSSDEFKGKTEVIRGRISFRVSPRDFERRQTSAGFSTESSGSRNPPVSTFASLEMRALQAAEQAVFYSAHDLYACAHALYEPLLAGRIKPILINGKLGIATDRWFVLKVDSHNVVESNYHYLNGLLIARMGSWYGPGIANPQYVDPRSFKPILEWIREIRVKGKTCCIATVVSNALRIARKSLETGLSLEGVTFTASGEPLTQSKKRVFEEAGARIALRYGPGGGNGASAACGNPQFIDEMHIPQSTMTLVENPRTLDDTDPPIHPLMLTTPHPAAPRLLFNVEVGDHATLLNRDCSCPLQRVGFTQHIHTVRSFEKMTSEGMNYSSSDLFTLLENTIPSEFGGEPGDYQLVEEEDDQGQTRLTLVIHPEVGPINEPKLMSRLQQGLAQGSRNHRFISKIWQDANTFRIRREAPFASSRGKILPLHIKQKH